jgi:hypothetical protein
MSLQYYYCCWCVQCCRYIYYANIITTAAAATTAHTTVQTTLLLLYTLAGKYEEAGSHAIKCYQYYLDGTHSEDTDVLTRLGNLQVCMLNL